MELDLCECLYVWCKGRNKWGAKVHGIHYIFYDHILCFFLNLFHL